MAAQVTVRAKTIVDKVKSAVICGLRRRHGPDNSCGPPPSTRISIGSFDVLSIASDSHSIRRSTQVLQDLIAPSSSRIRPRASLAVCLYGQDPRVHGADMRPQLTSVPVCGAVLLPCPLLSLSTCVGASFAPFIAVGGLRLRNKSPVSSSITRCTSPWPLNPWADDSRSLAHVPSPPSASRNSRYDPPSSRWPSPFSSSTSPR